MHFKNNKIFPFLCEVWLDDYSDDMVFVWHVAENVAKYGRDDFHKS